MMIDEEVGFLRQVFGDSIPTEWISLAKELAKFRQTPDGWRLVTTMFDQAMLAKCLQHSECEYFKLVQSDASSATFETKRKGHDPVRMSFTMDQAKRANLTRNPTWGSYPEIMLRWRAISNLAKMVYPDAMMGLYTTEELQSVTASEVIESPIEIPEVLPVVEIDEPKPVISKVQEVKAKIIEKSKSKAKPQEIEVPTPDGWRLVTTMFDQASAHQKVKQIKNGKELAIEMWNRTNGTSDLVLEAISREALTPGELAIRLGKKVNSIYDSIGHLRRHKHIKIKSKIEGKTVRYYLEK